MTKNSNKIAVWRMYKYVVIPFSGQGSRGYKSKPYIGCSTAVLGGPGTETLQPPMAVLIIQNNGAQHVLRHFIGIHQHNSK
jgi:hypothetical protein